jgi:hypothetical protein
MHGKTPLFPAKSHEADMLKQARKKTSRRSPNGSEPTSREIATKGRKEHKRVLATDRAILVCPISSWPALLAADRMMRPFLEIPTP